MNRNVRTDIAFEAAQLCDSTFNIEGAKVLEEKIDGVEITRVKIETESASEKIGKPIGQYVTVECKNLNNDDDEENKKIRKILAENIISLGKINKKKSVLVVGLGNWNITPDALGPKVVSEVVVTRHLFEQKEIDDDYSVCSVSAVSPGVLGITGVESGEIVKGVCENIKPDLIIAIDALASRSIERLSTTVQISDTGIIPGSGIGNSRNAITEKSMGVPVIAIGVPTVVDAATVANDSLQMLINAVRDASGESSPLYKALNSYDDDKRYLLIKEVLTPHVGSLIVTPKEVDEMIDNISSTIAEGINEALLDFDNYKIQ